MGNRVPSAATAHDRFEFGENWSRFLSLLSEERIRNAEESLREMLAVRDLQGRNFLDIGSGSGLFSLAARRLGARVHSFDFDARSVACALELRRRYVPDDGSWSIEQGSILDESYMRNLGQFDVVYSWGVLHHTGEMWRALDLAVAAVAPAGLLFIAIYNLQAPARHRLLLAMKRTYVRSGPVLRGVLLGAYFCHAFANEVLVGVLTRRSPLARIREYSETSRGMSWWHDVVDWVGGYPYEAAPPEAIVEHCRRCGLHLEKLARNDGHGCNQFVFSRPAAA